MENQNFSSPSPLSPTPPAIKKWYRHNGLIAMAVLIVIAAAVVSVYFSINKSKNSNITKTVPASLKVGSPSVYPPVPGVAPGNFIYPPTPTTSLPSAMPSANGTASTSQVIMDGGYELFVLNSFEQSNNFNPNIQYLDDGIISSGQYAGYHRVAAYTTSDENYGGTATYIFATKDYQKFILDTNTDSTAEADLTDPNTIFNTAKVVGAGSIPSNFPATIDEGNFIMVQGQPDWNSFVSGTPSLSSNSPGLSFYAEPVKIPSPQTGSEDSGYQTLIATEQKYISANTNILVQDQAGLAYDYSFISKEEYNRSKGKGGPTFIYDFNFYKQDELNSNVPVYQEYGELFPGGCGEANLTYVLQNISSSDLSPIATTLNGGVQLYTLKDPNHPLNQEEYYSKITAWKDEFGGINNNQPIPSYQTYLAF